MGEKAVEQSQEIQSEEEVTTTFKDNNYRTNTGKFYRVLFSQALPKWLWIGMWDKLPADAMLQACGFDAQRGCHFFVIWSEAFPVTEPGFAPELTAIANQLSGTVDLVEYDPKLNDYVERKWNETPSN